MSAYLDHNATAVVRPEARAAMAHALEHVGNPSSIHAAGRTARALLETAREQVAALIAAPVSTMARAARPAAWIEEGLPPTSSARAMAALASGRTTAVALWSR